VPVGFWFHFLEDPEGGNALENKNIVQVNLAGHQAFFDAFKPDFLKLMSDGFFRYPNPQLFNPKTVADLGSVKPLGKDHPWITEQIALVSELSKRFGSQVFTFYNIFGPATTLRFLWDNQIAQERFQSFLLQDAKALAQTLEVIAEDLSHLVSGIISQAGADGIYLSVQDVQDSSLDEDLYRSYIAPAELQVLEEANKQGGKNILHICGYEGRRNRLSLFQDYPASIFNWAVNVEDLSLAEGKALFHQKPVIGGFANSPGSLIHTGDKAAIQNFARGLVKGAGKRGLMVGADCSIPSDIDIERIDWVREALK